MTQISNPTTVTATPNWNSGQVMDDQKFRRKVRLVLVVFGQLGQYGVEASRLFAHGDHFAEHGGEETAGQSQRVGRASP